MKVPCQNLTISKVTISDIGTKFVKIRIQVPVFYIKSKNQVEFHLSLESISRYVTFSKFWIVHVVPSADPIAEAKIYMTKTSRIYLFVTCIMFDVL